MTPRREFDVILEPQSDGGFTAYVPDLPGCISEGDTRDQSLSMIKEAIEVYLESLEAHGEAVPPRVERERVTIGG